MGNDSVRKRIFEITPCMIKPVLLCYSFYPLFVHLIIIKRILL